VSPFHRPARAAAVAAFALAPLALFAAPVAAAAPALSFAPMQHASAGTPASSAPSFLKHGFQISNATVTSTNWSGYAATGSTYTSVSTTYTQPSVSCSGRSGTYAAFWVGLDGYSSSTVEQTGTLAYCSGSRAEYVGWYEMYPQGSNDYSNTVAAGNTIFESVTFSGSDVYTLVLEDETRGWTKTTVVDASGDARSSAEVIAEAPSSSTGVLPLADFGTVTFDNSLVNGSSLSSFSPTAINMVSSSGAAEATTSAFSGDNFSVAWKSE
jgi:hypothetical protein